MKDVVPFCMRCFGISAVPVDEETNFCHNCGSQGTCIAIKRSDADYLRENIQYAVERVRKNDNIFPEPTSDKEAFKKIVEHFLGKDWYVVDPISHDQVNTIAVDEIIKKYPKKKNRFGLF